MSRVAAALHFTALGGLLVPWVHRRPEVRARALLRPGEGACATEYGFLVRKHWIYCHNCGAVEVRR